MPVQTLKITSPIVVAKGDVLRDCAVDWQGGTTNEFAIVSSGVLENITVSCRGRCSGVLQSGITYSDALERVKIVQYAGVGIRVENCWGNRFGRVTISSGTGVAIEATKANATHWESLAINQCNGLPLAIRGGHSLSMESVAIESCWCDGKAMLLADVIGCDIRGLYLEDNRGVDSCVCIESGPGNRLFGSGISIRTATVVSRHERHGCFVRCATSSNGLSVRSVASRHLLRCIADLSTGDNENAIVEACDVDVPDFA